MSTSSKVSKQFGAIQTSTQTSNVSGGGSTLIPVNSNVVLVNASAAAAHLVLPTVATPGQTLTVVQSVAGNNTTIIESNGNTLLGSAVSVVLSGLSTSVTLTHVSQSLGWAISANNGGTVA